MILTYRHKRDSNFTVVGPFVPYPSLGGQSCIAVTINYYPWLKKPSLSTGWLDVCNPFWGEVDRCSELELIHLLGQGWKILIADELLNLLSEVDVSKKDLFHYLDAQDEVISWCLGCSRYITVGEASLLWRKSGIRQRIYEKFFDEHEYRKSANTWILRISGLKRKYGWPDLYVEGDEHGQT